MCVCVYVCMCVCVYVCMCVCVYVCMCVCVYVYAYLTFSAKLALVSAITAVRSPSPDNTPYL